MKKMLYSDKWEKWCESINESGLHRVYGWIIKHDSVILSAFRNEYTKKENYKRNRVLRDDLRRKGYGITKVKGSYIEGFDTDKAVEVSEQSLFVVNLKDNNDFNSDLINRGHKWEQDSILIIPKGGKDAYLYGTSETNDYPPFQEKQLVGSLKMGEEDEFMTRVSGRPFIFKEELETYENLSRNSRWAIREMLKDEK
tara:strand:- start:3080 stop:3670 length:591 start_codon:yes stop_codon:yes gene_type:complete